MEKQDLTDQADTELIVSTGENSCPQRDQTAQHEPIRKNSHTH